MANKKNLSAFRQLSLSCDGPKIQQKFALKKQFSEDLPDLREWQSQDIGFKISLANKGIRNPIKHAWVENTPSRNLTEEAVIVNKCRDFKRTSSEKLSRQVSLEKDSILNSKQELGERLRQTFKDKGEEKFNLQIFLAHDSRDPKDDSYFTKEKNQSHASENQPKLISPLVSSTASKNPFRIRKPIRSRTIDSCSSYSPTTTSKEALESSAVVVVPVLENDDPSCTEVSVASKAETDSTGANMKAINSVIIRPVSAASKRDKFQKRVNSAFTSTVKETPKPRRPLVRSSSAPCKPDYGKSKQKFKPFKRLVQSKTISVDNEDDEENSDKSPKSKKELNRTTAVNGCDIVTMVSLVSPAGSDCEEAVESSRVENCKNTPKKEKVKKEQEEIDIPRILSLRKAAKSVSFQQSSIHAIRSFSASFPARRASVATALMFGNHLKSVTPKVQEKRSTNSTIPDDNERVPKRRLVRSNTEEPKTVR
ncbi:hypothetical protein JTB14_032699 [Gonioctena quinquepunctata]|nr:hypothetical protein JTB14_032699 [Gonioctena quinquepunctata]